MSFIELQRRALQKKEEIDAKAAVQAPSVTPSANVPAGPRKAKGVQPWKNVGMKGRGKTDCALERVEVPKRKTHLRLLLRRLTRSQDIIRIFGKFNALGSTVSFTTTFHDNFYPWQITFSFPRTSWHISRRSNRRCLGSVKGFILQLLPHQTLVYTNYSQGIKRLKKI